MKPEEYHPETEQLVEALRELGQGPPLQIDFDPITAFLLHGALSLVTRHPHLPDVTRSGVNTILTGLETYLSRSPLLANVLAAGRDPRCDVPAIEQESLKIPGQHSDLYLLLLDDPDGMEYLPLYQLKPDTIPKPAIFFTPDAIPTMRELLQLIHLSGEAVSRGRIVRYFMRETIEESDGPKPIQKGK